MAEENDNKMSLHQDASTMASSQDKENNQSNFTNDRMKSGRAGKRAAEAQPHETKMTGEKRSRRSSM